MTSPISPRLRVIVLIALAAITIFVPSSYADRRKFVWAYQYGTIAPDATELEFYQTTKLAQEDKWEYRIEIEQGLTPKWDFSIYQIFAQPEGGPLRWDAFQLRTRYRLADPGSFLLDPLLYLEYNRPTDLTAQNKAEAKLILSRDMGRATIAFDPVYELAFAPGEVKSEWGIDAGMAYEFSYSFSLALESSSRWESIAGEVSGVSYLGPTISLAKAKIYYSAGVQWGISEASDDARVRLLIGVGL